MLFSWDTLLAFPKDKIQKIQYNMNNSHNQAKSLPKLIAFTTNCILQERQRGSWKKITPLVN